MLLAITAALTLTLARADILRIDMGVEHERAWLRKMYSWRWLENATLLDVGGATPDLCFSDGLFRPGDAIADFQAPTKSCFTEADRSAITFLQVDLESDRWDAVEDYVAVHGKFGFSIMSHTLEDIQNVKGALQKLSRFAQTGLIVTPSKFTELHRFELDILAAQGHLARVGPWTRPGWRGYYHHRWIFIARPEGHVLRMYGIPKSSVFESDPELDGITSQKAKEWIGELRIFWKDSISMDVPFCYGFHNEVATYRQLLALDDYEKNGLQKLNNFKIADPHTVFDSGYSGLESKLSSLGQGRICLALRETLDGKELTTELCDHSRHLWFLDSAGKLQNMLNPGWCITASIQIAVDHCPKAIGWDMVVAWGGPPWFIIKSRDFADICLGLAPNLTAVARSCHHTHPHDTLEHIFWRASDHTVMLTMLGHYDFKLSF